MTKARIAKVAVYLVFMIIGVLAESLLPGLNLDLSKFINEEPACVQSHGDGADIDKLFNPEESK